MGTISRPCQARTKKLIKRNHNRGHFSCGSCQSSTCQRHWCCTCAPPSSPPPSPSGALLPLPRTKADCNLPFLQDLHTSSPPKHAEDIVSNPGDEYINIIPKIILPKDIAYLSIILNPVNVLHGFCFTAETLWCIFIFDRVFVVHIFMHPSSRQMFLQSLFVCPRV